MLTDSAAVFPSLRLMAGKPLTLPYVYVDAEGEPATAPATPTLAVTNLAGATVTADAVATETRDDGDRPAIYTAAINASEVPSPDLLTCVWTSSGAAETRYVELAGRFYFTNADWHRYQDASGQTSVARTRDARLADARMTAEQECERICGRSFVRRARRVRVSAPRRATSRLVLPDADVVSVRAVQTVDGGASYDSAQLANLQVAGSMLVRRDGSTWADAPDWYDVTYEFGLLQPPAEIQTAVMRRTKYWLQQSDSRTPDWATSVDVEGMGSYRVGETAMNSGMTGDETVNAIYRRHRRAVNEVVA